MRLLHTSDWHLGRSFHGFGLLGAQARFLDWLLELVAQESVDVVVVAGDIYDRAIPPVDAVELYDDALARFATAGVPVFMISGNHDSATRLGVGSRVLSRGGVHLRTDARMIGQPVVLDSPTGPLALYGIPYLEPDAVRDTLALTERSHQAALDAAMSLVRADLATRPAGTRSVVASHSFVTGAAASDSERDIRVGGADSVSAATFAGVDYVALGHLHGPQVVADPVPGRVRYSGSPLAYSFSERHHTKSVTLLTLDSSGVADAQTIPVPVHRRLSTLSGELAALLRDPAHDPLTQDYLAVTLTDQGAPNEPMARLRQRFPHVATLSWEPAGGLSPDRGSYTERVHGLSDSEICCDFVRHVRNDEPSDDERALFEESLESSRAVPVIPPARHPLEDIPASREPEEAR